MADIETENRSGSQEYSTLQEMVKLLNVSRQSVGMPRPFLAIVFAFLISSIKKERVCMTILSRLSIDICVGFYLASSTKISAKAIKHWRQIYVALVIIQTLIVLNAPQYHI